MCMCVYYPFCCSWPLCPTQNDAKDLKKIIGIWVLTSYPINSNIKCLDGLQQKPLRLCALDKVASALEGLNIYTHTHTHSHCNITKCNGWNILV